MAAGCALLAPVSEPAAWVTAVQVVGVGVV